jgi:hypothetical protein
MPTSPGLPTSNNWGWAETLKNSFILVELGPLHKNGLSSLSITRVITHSEQKGEWQHTQGMWALQLKIVYKKSRSWRIKLGEWREARLSLNKNFASIVFLSLELISFSLYMASKFWGKNDLVRWIKSSSVRELIFKINLLK